jgi:PAS domain S-box-containing protein
MMRISFGSLPTRLILIVLLVVIPAFGLSLYSGLKQRHDALSRAQENALSMAKNACDVQERLIENTHQILFTLSQMPEVRQLNVTACTNVLNNLQTRSKVYSVFFATKPNGDVFASALPLSRPMNFADRPWYRQVIQTRKFVIGEYQIGRITGKATLGLIYPVLDSKGKLKAILATELDLGWLNQFMAESKAPAGTTLTVVDRKGTILLRYPEPETFTGKTMPEGSILKAILAKEEGVSEAISLDGIPRLYGFTSLDRFAKSVYVSVGIPKEIAFAAATREMRRNLIWLGIVGALAIITAWFGSSFLIIRPVDRLLGATKRLAEGDLAVRTGPRYDRGEIGQLAFAFDQMGEALEKREAERKRAEEALRYERDFADGMIETAQTIVLVLDTQGRIVRFNPYMEEISGYVLAEVQGKDWFTTFLPERDREHTRNLFLKALSDIQMCGNVNPIVTKDGREREVEWYDKTLRDAQGNVNGLLAIGQDITERKQAEEEIRKLNIGLEQRVAERTVELKIAKEKAQEADRLKSVFLATMSHELRTPLNSIIGFTGILLQGLVGPLSDEQTKQLSMVRRSAHHLLNLINDVLDISKIEAGQVEIVSNTLNMKETIDRVVRTVTPLAEKRGLAIFTEVTPEVGSIISDRRRVEQILINLLNNAIKFTEKGEVRVECQVRGGWLATRVVDTGIGIESEDMAKLFKPFEQIDTGLTRRHEGTGLGLSICKRLIELLGGEILVESEGLGKGSTFTLKLPLKT